METSFKTILFTPEQIKEIQSVCTETVSSLLYLRDKEILKLNERIQQLEKKMKEKEQSDNNLFCTFYEKIKSNNCEVYDRLNNIIGELEKHLRHVFDEKLNCFKDEIHNIMCDIQVINKEVELIKCNVKKNEMKICNVSTLAHSYRNDISSLKEITSDLSTIIVSRNEDEECK